KVVGVGTNRFEFDATGQDAFDNTGLIDLQSGGLYLGKGGTHTGGSFMLATNTVLVFGTGTHLLDSTSQIVGQGQVLFLGANVTVNGTYQLTTSPIISERSVTFNQPTLNLPGLTFMGGSVYFNQSSISFDSLVLTNGTIGGIAALTITKSM